MATITEPMALDKTFNTTETTPRSQADVLAAIENAIRQGFGRSAADVSYDNTTSGLTADDVQEAIDELADEKVDKVAGKGLSTNDYTDEDKEALDNMELDIAGTQTVSGNPLTLTDAAPINAESLVVELEPIQEGSGDPSPTNIRPITGYTECDVDDVGKNLFDVNADKTPMGAVYAYYYTLDPDTYYTLSCNVDTANTASLYFNGTAQADYVFTNAPKTRKTDVNGNLVVYVRYTASGDGIDLYSAVLNGTKWIQLEKSDTQTAYEPYRSSNATIQFGQTVYGGSVDFETGKVTVDHVKETKTSISGSKPNYYCTASQSADRTKQLDIICDKMNTASSVGAEGVYINSNGALMLKTSMYESATDLLSAMGGEFDVCFAIANPFEIQLTPQELKLLKQYNNITTNGTTINLGYQPDNVIGDVKGEIEKCSPNPEFMHFEVNGNVVDAVPIIFDEAIHSYTVIGDNWKDKTFLCVECCDMRYGILQLVLSSDMAFVDSCGKALLLYPYIRSVEQYIKITISLGQSYGYEISYQTTNTQSLLDYLKIRVRLFN